MHIPLQARKAAVEKYRRKNGGKDFPNPIYAAMVESVDMAVGQLRSRLDRLGIADNTILIVTSDNGGVRYPVITDNSPLRAGKGHLYEGGIREPLIVHWPGVTKAGTVLDDAVLQHRLSSDHARDGRRRGAPGRGRRELRGTGRRKKPPQREALYWHYPHYSNQGGVPAGAVRKGDWKLIEFYEDGRLELYNVREDIGERRNLVEKEPRKRAELHALLKRWRVQVKAAMPRVNPQYDPTRKSPGADGREPPTGPV